MVRGGVNMGIAGVPHWGGDIGGFHCVVDGFAAANGELLTRWIEQGSMTSNMQDQNACSGALDTGVKASIWNSTDAQHAWGEYARLHTRLFPYLYSLAYDAHRTGAPTMRHLFLEHPDRPELASTDDEYYFGPGLLVAPVVQRNARMRNVTFPPGRFFDWRDGRLYEGGQTVMVDAPLDKLPLFLRDGYIVPLLDASIDTLDDTETNPDVVGPRDVADVFDVVGLVSAPGGPTDGGVAGTVATFALWDRTQLSARWAGGFAVPSGFTEATDANDLATCTACYRRDAVPGATNVTRVRISATAASVDAGGLHLTYDGSRRIRWDLYLVE
jgi:alpha-D-xyloside xylohydrolase